LKRHLAAALPALALMVVGACADPQRISSGLEQAGDGHKGDGGALSLCDEGPQALQDVHFHAVRGGLPVDLLALHGQVRQGDMLTAIFTVRETCQDLEILLTSHTVTDGDLDLFDGVTGHFQPGTHALSVQVPACFFQVGFALGATLLEVDKGGEDACGNSAAPVDTPPPASCPTDLRVLSSHHFEVLRDDQPLTLPTLRQNLREDDLVTAVFTVDAACTAVMLSLASYEATGPGAGTEATQHLHSGATGVFGAGEHRLTVRIPPCFFQADFAFGPVLTDFRNGGYGPALIDADNGGTHRCGHNNNHNNDDDDDD